MSIFKRVENIISSYIGDFLDDRERAPQTARHNWIDQDIADAWNELNDFLRQPSDASERSSFNREPSRVIPSDMRQDFAELGVPAGAPLADCKAAYRKLIKKYHPDTSDESGAALFMRIKAAYDRIVKWYGTMDSA